MDQFIKIYDNVVPKEWCNMVIEDFNNNLQKSYNRTDDRILDLRTKDTQYNPLIHLSEEEGRKYAFPFFKALEECYNDYRFQISCPDFFNFSAFKVQRTLPGEGYHQFHCEDNFFIPNDEDLVYLVRRFAVFTLYLNDVEEGGETEFLYQHLRIPPKSGTLCIFPSSYPYIHRGNPPLSGEKYIVTGWFEIPLEKDIINRDPRQGRMVKIIP